MGKKTLFISILGGILIVISLVTFVNDGRKESEESKGDTKAVTNRNNLIVQAEEYEKEGKYLEAKTLYWKAIEESSDNKIISEAEKKLYALNMKILFSPIITEDNHMYTVVKGNSLTKIAKKFGTTIELLKKSNSLSSDMIRPGMELKVSSAKYSIVVDRSQNILILKSNDQILKTYSVSTGKDNSTPLGNFKVINKLVNPTWYSAGAVVSPDSPENILGSRWIGISKAGYGIHGTTQPETIGSHLTAGCVRMLKEDVEELYSIIPVGAEVTIVD